MDRPHTAWYLRVVPITALAVSLAGALLWLFPEARHEMRLSTSRTPESVVELYFHRPAPDGRERACVRHGSRLRVGFVLASHRRDERVLRYQVTVEPDRSSSRAKHRSGQVAIAPGQQVPVTAQLTAPRGAYTASVRLPELGQEIRVHCEGSR